jgi:hypothetical protein
MVTEKDYPPNWVILPGSSLTAELEVDGWPKPTIVVRGNREGLFSLGNLLLWISHAPVEHESLSITGLPFVHAKSTLCLMVVQVMRGSDEDGGLVRTDKDKQFQWLINDEQLRIEAASILSMSYRSDFYCDDHVHGYVAPDSEYDLILIRKRKKWPNETCVS